jgi:hypothetical protein
MLAYAFVLEGQYASAFPVRGREAGAPVAAFLRFDEKPVRRRTRSEPDCIAYSPVHSDRMRSSGLRVTGSQSWHAQKTAMFGHGLNLSASWTPLRWLLTKSEGRLSTRACSGCWHGHGLVKLESVISSLDMNFEENSCRKMQTW